MSAWRVQVSCPHQGVGRRWLWVYPCRSPRNGLWLCCCSIGKRRKTDKPFSMQWFYSFMSRWPELHVVKPSSLSEQRARCASEESINKYFSELEHIITKYPLKDKPHLIYNIDEKGINTETRPPNVVAGKYYQPQMVIAETSELVTVIGAGNALGSSVPPFFVFPGQRMLPGLLEGKTVGADAEFSETPNPAYFYAYFCFCMRKISFRGFSFTLCCHRTSKLNFEDVPRTSEISFVRRNRYPRCPKIVKKPAHF